MALANITVTANTPNVSVSAGTTNVSVSQTLSNITVGTATGIATSEIRSALSNTSPILYDSSTGVFSFDNTAILNATVVDNGSLSGNITLDLDAGRIHKVALGLGNITGITLDNITSGAAATLIFTQDAGGGVALDTTTHASNWTSWDFANDFKTFDDNPLNWTVMNLFYDGSKIYASLVTDSAGNITNAELANSNVIINGVTIDLGSSGNISANMDLTQFSVTTNTPSGNGALSYSNTTGVFTFTPADTSSGGIDLTALSVTTNSPSGNGALSYNNTSGVFTFTPSDVPDTTDELTEGATNLYFTDARANTVIGTNTTDNLTEGSTNLYYTDSRFDTRLATKTTDDLTEGSTNLYYTTTRANSAISTYFGDSGNFPFSFAGNLSVSGNVDVAGNLNYENVTDLYVTDQKITLNANAATDATVEIIANRPVAGANTVLRWNETDDKWQFSNDGSTYNDILTNAQAQAYIQESGLTMTADITSSNLIGTTANLDLNSSTAVDNLYGFKWVNAVNKFISSPDAGTTAPDYLFTIEKESTDLEAIRSTIARSGAFGWKERYEKAEGTLASPTALGNYDETWQAQHYGHDGTNGYGGPDGNASMGFHVFQDAQTASVSANIVPMAYEIYGGLNGAIQGTFNSSFMSIHSDGKIVFNDTGGVRGFNTKTGTANISRDGSIVSAADITSRANIVAEANINAAGGTLTGVLTSNSNIAITDAFFEGDLDGAVVIDVYNNTGVTLIKGEAVYLTGGNQGDNPNVALADNSVASQMPAIGIVRESISATAVGQVVTSGEINLALHGLTPGADLFVGTGGGITENPPTGESGLIQKIGKVVGPNHILIQGAFRSNQVSNLNDGNFFIGNAANQATTASFSSEANTAIAANLAALTSVISSTSNITTTANVSGNYILGNGSALTGISTNAFDQILVSGQSNIDASGATALTFAESGDITITTDAGTGTVTIGGTASAYGNTQVNNFLVNEGVSDGFKINSDEGFITIQANHASNTATAGNDFARFRSRGTIASASAVQDGDTIALSRFFGYDGDSYEDSFHSNVYVDGTVSDGDVPMGMKFAPVGVIANPPAAIDMRANSEIKFAGGNASISSTGVLTTAGNITTTANISGGYILGNGSGLTGLTTSLLSDFSSASNSAIAANLAALTSVISTTSNVQINSETDISGLKGLTFDTSTNNLGLGTATPGAALHIRGTSNEAQIFMTEYNGTSSAGPDLRTFRAGGTEASPTVTPKSDRIWEQFHYTYDGVGTSGDGISTGFQTAFAEQIITDPVVDHTANTVPVFHQFYTYLDGDATTTPHALMRMRSNGDIQFNAGSAFSYTTAANTVISNAGEITTAGNISGNYILGNGSALTGIATDTFNQILVSGEANVDASGPTSLTLVPSGAITINTDAANNTVTIGGSGGSYGDSNVTSLLEGNTVTTNIVIQGYIESNDDVKAANAVFTDNIYSYTPGGTFTMNAVRVTDFKANDPLNIDSTANSNLSGGVYAAPFTGAIVYVTGDRHGARGAPAYFDGTSWRYFSDDANVTI